MPRRRNNNNNRRRNGRIRVVAKRALHSELYGAQLRGSADPPPFTQVPWWQITVANTFTSTTGNYNITPNVLVSALKSQTGLTQADAGISVRLISVHFWLTIFPSEGQQSITLSCRDLAEAAGTADNLKVIADNGARNRYSHVHYKWPTSQRTLAFSGSDTQRLANLAYPANGGGAWRAQILWSCRPSITNRLFPSRYDQMDQRIEELRMMLELLHSQLDSTR